MRRDFPTQAAAQAFADAVHQRMVASDAAYAGSVAKGHTTAWAIPYQDLDENEQPVSASWFVNLKARVDKVLTAPERASLKVYRRG